ncbi:AAA family ATPase [Methylorubrum populi]
MTRWKGEHPEHTLTGIEDERCAHGAKPDPIIVELLDRLEPRPPAKSRSRNGECRAPHERRGTPPFGTVRGGELRPDMVGAAILLGAGLRSAPDLLERLDSGVPVVVVEVTEADWIDPTAKAAAACFSPVATTGWRGDRRDAGGEDVELERAGAVVIAARNGVRHSSESDVQSDGAFRDHRPLIGITTSARIGLPADLLKACEETVVLGRFNPEAISLLVERVVGAPPTMSVSGAIAAEIGPADLRISVHRARGANGSIERLRTLVGSRLDLRRKCTGTRLQDCVGYGLAAEWGIAAAQDLAAFARNELPWCQCEPGVLLSGPPGTGKTMFAALLADQAGVALIAGSLAQWQSSGEGHLGTTLKAMRQFFETAKRTAPCVALIDELDSFGDRRHFAHHNRDYSVQVVNGFLECLDGDGGRAGVVLVGTTNHPDWIDPAILRSGRFDRRIDIPLPSMTDLAAILRQHLGRDLTETDLMLAARHALGSTGADCAAWVRRARARARRECRSLKPGDLLREIGAPAPATAHDQEWRIAVHESGHAIVAHSTGREVLEIVLRSPVPQVSSITSIQIDGTTTRDALHDLLAVIMAGRAAEILVFGEPSAGAASDLIQATAISNDLHCRWGLGDRLAACDPKRPPSAVRTAVEEDLRRALANAEAILEARRPDLVRVAEALQEHRSLTRDEVAALLDPGSPPTAPPSTAGQLGPTTGPSLTSVVPT